jgi:hypothetical protein
MILALLIIPALAGAAGQGETGLKPAPAEVPAPSPCLIVKHKGLVGRRLMWFALIAIPIAPGAKYDLVDSVNYKPDRVAFKGKHLQELQKQNVRVIVLEKNYKQESLEAARKSCREPNSASPAE